MSDYILAEERTKGSHTPGPWTCDPNGDGWRVTAHTPMKDGGKLFTRVATVHGMKGYDARLIGAAPELLAALRRLVDVLADGEWGTHEHGLAGDAARRAIAQAEGKL